MPTILREHATSEPNIAMRKRKRDDDISRADILEMFSVLQKKQEDITVIQKKQDEKFSALMNKIQGGINSHTEQNKEISCSIDLGSNTMR